MATITENIKFLRVSRNWTKKELAERLGYESYTTITKWESGDHHPRGSDIVKLCKLFNVSSDYLLGMDSTNNINYYKYYPVSASAGLLENIESIRECDTKWIAVDDDALGKYANSPDIFFVNVSGTSMDKVIKPDSRIGVKPLYSFKQLNDADIVLFSNAGEFSIKRMYIDTENGRFLFRPQSTDPSHIDIVINFDDADQIVIHGKVISTLAQYE
jgi:repressor LexA